MVDLLHAASLAGLALILGYGAFTLLRQAVRYRSSGGLTQLPSVRVVAPLALLMMILAVTALLSTGIRQYDGQPLARQPDAQGTSELVKAYAVSLAAAQQRHLAETSHYASSTRQLGVDAGKPEHASTKLRIYDEGQRMIFRTETRRDKRGLSIGAQWIRVAMTPTSVQVSCDNRIYCRDVRGDLRRALGATAGR